MNAYILIPYRINANILITVTYKCLYTDTVPYKCLCTDTVRYKCLYTDTVPYKCLFSRFICSISPQQSHNLEHTRPVTFIALFLFLHLTLPSQQCIAFSFDGAFWMGLRFVLAERTWICARPSRDSNHERSVLALQDRGTN
jgi:hypothetical protein